jgi:YgiT-type zinc finger domain-containing protein
MKFKDKESGQVLVITAFCMIGFMGFLAMAVDVGILFHTRWQLQIAADAAATAAAVEYLHNVQTDGSYDSASAITGGTNAATTNNPSDGNTMTATVTVNANANSPAELLHDTRDIPYTYKGESTVIPAVTGDLCPACGEAILDATESARSSAISRSTHRLWILSSSSAFAKSSRSISGKPPKSSGAELMRFRVTRTGKPNRLWH